MAGRARPTKEGDVPKIYRMRVFAPNALQARSRFWYFLAKLRKVKRAVGEIVSCTEVWGSLGALVVVSDKISNIVFL